MFIICLLVRLVNKNYGLFSEFLDKEGIMEFLERLELLRKEKGIAKRQLEAEAGLASSSVSKWKHRDPSMASLEKLADYFNVSVDYLLGNSDRRERVAGTEKAVKIPVYGVVPAGIPLEAIQCILDYEEISEEMALKGEFFALKVKGDSMAPRIQEGDVLIIRQQADAETGDIVIAAVNGDDATVKKLVKTSSGIVLQPLNPAYDPLIFSNDDIASIPVRIYGKVIENRQKF
jgi:repressor LexA